MMLVRADQSAVIGINPSRKAEQETGRSVGARVVDVGLGGPSWSPAGWGVIVFLQAVSQGNRTRATIKAHPTALHPPSPLRSTQHYFVTLMRMRAGFICQSALLHLYISLWGAMNCAP